MKTPEKNRTLMFAMCSSGAAIGNLAVPPFLTYMISEYGWRGTFLLVSGLALHLDKAQHSTIQRLSTNKVEQESFKSSTRTFIRYRKLFVTFGISVVLLAVVVSGRALFMPDLMKEVSLSNQQIYTTLMAMGFGHLIGSLLPGVLERFFQLDILNMYLVVLLAGSITSMAFTGVSSFIMFTTLAFMTGTITGALLCLQVPIVALYLHKEYTDIGFGRLYTLEGVVVILDIPLAGLIIDLTQTVRSGFVLTVGVMFLSLVVTFITKMLIKFEQKQQNT